MTSTSPATTSTHSAGKTACQPSGLSKFAVSTSTRALSGCGSSPRVQGSGISSGFGVQSGRGEFLPEGEQDGERAPDLRRLGGSAVRNLPADGLIHSRSQTLVVIWYDGTKVISFLKNTTYRSNTGISAGRPRTPPSGTGRPSVVVAGRKAIASTGSMLILARTKCASVSDTRSTRRRRRPSCLACCCCSVVDAAVSDPAASSCRTDWLATAAL
ncbi:hypothetical protein T265_08338 [Opisthorchis viverrini]|uniref:Uncharacterized protein n=1 Tax=Opisthorchis viverrini TaxID=6198 RepID=A0A074ZKJ1_OPIVI|nr:hypothetical protein T265_08338 [Opisthorchis viverrini]KER23875.1 hypothetical protein T265_08338 [Opisthorchis viverrini]